MSFLWTRRRLMQTAVTSALGVSLARLAAAQQANGADAAGLPERAIELVNTHTGESAYLVYKRGRALDVRLKHCPITDLRDLALAAKQCGVSYYQRSDFVHIDTVADRTWIG